jgi:hypothetical protein
MAQKNEYNKAYDKGYREGKEGGIIDDIFQANKNIIPLPPPETEKSYDAGYEDGRADRYDDSNSNYHGSTSQSGGCFITTDFSLSRNQ